MHPAGGGALLLCKLTWKSTDLFISGSHAPSSQTRTPAVISSFTFLLLLSSPHLSTAHILFELDPVLRGLSMEALCCQSGCMKTGAMW